MKVKPKLNIPSLLSLSLFLLVSINGVCDITKLSDVENMNAKNAATFTLFKDKPFVLNEELSLTLKYFSHKSSVDGTHMKASARIMVKMEKESFEILLSTYTDNTDTSLKKKHTFDKLYSHGYEFHLKSFDYGSSIDIIVQKSTRDWPSDFPDETYF